MGDKNGQGFWKSHLGQLILTGRGWAGFLWGLRGRAQGLQGSGRQSEAGKGWAELGAWELAAGLSGWGQGLSLWGQLTPGRPVGRWGHTPVRPQDGRTRTHVCNVPHLTFPKMTFPRVCPGPILPRGAEGFSGPQRP